MKTSFLLGIDIGSSSVKASVVDADSGKCVASSSFPKVEAPIISVKSGWAEQDPESWWTSTKDCLHEIIAGGKIAAGKIKAVGISYQMHGLVCVGKDFKPLRHAIIWCDSRAIPYGEKAFDRLGHEKCFSSLLNSPGNFTAAKLAWVKENEPEVFEKLYKIMLPGDYIAMRLSGDICTTASGLSEGILWDFRKNEVADFVLDYFGFDKSLIPDVVPTFGVQGKVSAEAARETGLPVGIPITYRAGDQPNNALSLNVFNPGEIASTAGTSGVVYGVNGTLDYDRLNRVNTFAHVNHAEGHTRLGVLLCINGTGIMNSWLRRNVASGSMGYEEMNLLAEKAPVGSDGVAVVPFGNGAERMLENREVGCSIDGINFNKHDKSHIIRAAQEGVAFSFCYGIEIMNELGMNINKIHAGRANMFLSPLFRTTIAEVSGSTIELYDTDGSAGAARGAGLGLGIYKSGVEAFASLERLDVVRPTANRQRYLEAYSHWKSVLEGRLTKVQN